VAQKFIVPITVRQLASAGSDAFTIYVDQDTYSRIQIQAGGRIVWGSGEAVADTNLYRDDANVLKTDDTFKSAGLFVAGVQIDTAGAAIGDALVFNGTKFVSASVSNASLIVSDTAPAGAEQGDLWFESDTSQTFVYYNSNWVPVGITSVNSLDEIGDVSLSSPTAGQILVYNGSAWVNQDNSVALLDIDGGTSFDEIYEAELTNMIEAVYDGGTL
jgi:hypothetical protein